MTLLLGGGAFAGCGGGGGEPDRPDNGLWETTEGCESVALERASAQPLDFVRLEVTPAELTDVYVRVVPSETDPAYPAAVFEDDTGIGVQVPPHPSGIGGGAVQLQVTDGETVCPPVDMTIEPLEPAPGTLQQTVEGLQELIDVGARGMNVEGSVADAVTHTEDGLEVDLPLQAAFFGHAQFAVDHPDNPVSMARLADHPVAADGGLEILEALLGKANAPARIAETTDFIESSRPIEWAPASDGRALGIPGDRPVIENAAQLSEHVQDAAFHCSRGTSGYDEVVSGAGLVANVRIPVLKAAAVGFSATGTVLSAISATYCAFLPEKLTNLRPRPGTLDFEEDREEPLGFDEVLVDAEPGKRVNVGKRLFDLALQVKSLRAGFGTSASTFEEFAKSTGDDLLAWIAETINGMTLDQLRTLEVGAVKWANIDINGRDWIHVLPQEGFVRTVGCGERDCLVPAEVGNDEVEVVNKLEPFPRNEVSATVAAVVHPIDVDIGPVERLVTPGITLDFDYAVQWALDPTLEWTSSVPLTFSPSAMTSDASGTVTVDLPADESMYPITVVAESKSTGGLRDPAMDPPPRRRASVLRIGDILVGPDGACVEPGGTLRMEAVVVETGDVEPPVMWTASGGDISADGLFTAPEEAGTYTVTGMAELPTREVMESVEVTVGECKCWYSLQVTGEIATSHREDFGFTSDWSSTDDHVIYAFNVGDPFALRLSFDTPDVDLDGTYAAEAELTNQGYLSEGAFPLVVENEGNDHFTASYTAVMCDKLGPPDFGCDYAVLRLDFRAVTPLDEYSSAICFSEGGYDVQGPGSEDL